jgi:folate-dependent phosphoribosylglycinamide formyltransferase PurN
MTSDAPTVCLLVEGPTVPEWQAAALSDLFERTDATVTAIGYNAEASERSLADTLRRAGELREWAVVGTVNEWLRTESVSGERVALADICDTTEVIEREIQPEAVDGWKQRLPAEPVEALAAEADICLRLGFGFIIGPVLSAFEDGVLSYHHGDLRRYRGQPMGFWEFLDGADTAGVTVQVLTDELDAGRVAAHKTVPIGDCQTWGAVKRRLFEASGDMLAEAVQNVQAGEVWEPETLGSLYTLPKGWAVARFTVKNLRGHVRERVGHTTSPSPASDL